MAGGQCAYTNYTRGCGGITERCYAASSVRLISGELQKIVESSAGVLSSMPVRMGPITVV